MNAQQLEDAIVKDLEAKWYYGGTPIARRPDILQSLRTILRPHLEQILPTPSFQYGPTGTIHSTVQLDVETDKGQVVAVWFRCMALPFRQSEADESMQGRADDMREMYKRGGIPKLLGLVLEESGGEK